MCNDFKRRQEVAQVMNENKHAVSEMEDVQIVRSAEDNLQCFRNHVEGFLEEKGVWPVKEKWAWQRFWTGIWAVRTTVAFLEKLQQPVVIHAIGLVQPKAEERARQNNGHVESGLLPFAALLDDMSIKISEPFVHRGLKLVLVLSHEQYSDDPDKSQVYRRYAKLLSKFRVQSRVK